MMTPRLPLPVLLSLLLMVTTVKADDGFVLLFDGESLDGWVQRGGAAVYAVEEGQIIGTPVLETGNSFLCPPRDYTDFVLEYEILVDPPLNSGVQIRSQCRDDAYTFRGKLPNGDPFERQIDAGCVHGYQVEIDPSERAWSGGIYDEARRGWINDLAENPEARAAFSNGEWNHYRVEARGDSIKTWVNGVPAADLVDDAEAGGLIGLQVHGIGNDKSLLDKRVRWRKLRIKEL